MKRRQVRHQRRSEKNHRALYRHIVMGGHNCGIRLPGVLMAVEEDGRSQQSGSDLHSRVTTAAHRWTDSQLATRLCRIRQVDRCKYTGRHVGRPACIRTRS
jgi:hypothetical protein